MLQIATKTNIEFTLDEHSFNPDLKEFQKNMSLWLSKNTVNKIKKQRFDVSKTQEKFHMAESNS